MALVVGSWRFWYEDLSTLRSRCHSMFGAYCGINLGSNNKLIQLFLCSVMPRVQFSTVFLHGPENWPERCTPAG